MRKLILWMKRNGKFFLGVLVAAVFILSAMCLLRVLRPAIFFPPRDSSAASDTEEPAASVLPQSSSEDNEDTEEFSVSAAFSPASDFSQEVSSHVSSEPMEAETTAPTPYYGELAEETWEENEDGKVVFLTFLLPKAKAFEPLERHYENIAAYIRQAGGQSLDQIQYKAVTDSGGEENEKIAGFTIYRSVVEGYDAEKITAREISEFVYNLYVHDALGGPAANEALREEEAPLPQNMRLTLAPGRVFRGETATLSIMGKPETEYQIVVKLKSGPSTAQGLETKVSDETGSVSWSWMIGTHTTPGDFTVRVSGGGEKLTAILTVE